MKTDVDNVLLCKDCKHSFVPYGHRLFFIFTKYVTDENVFMCKKSKEGYRRWNPVTGFETIETPVQRCSNYRETHCHREGRYWTPKHKKDLFKLLTKD